MRRNDTGWFLLCEDEEVIIFELVQETSHDCVWKLCLNYLLHLPGIDCTNDGLIFFLVISVSCKFNASFIQLLMSH